MGRIYVCDAKPPFLLHVTESDGITVRLVWDALKITYVLGEREYVRLETPVFNITLSCDKVINHLLDYVASLKCFEASDELGVTEY